MTPELKALVTDIFDIEDRISDLREIIIERTEKQAAELEQYHQKADKIQDEIAEIESPFRDTMFCLMEEAEEKKLSITALLLEADLKTVDLDIAKVQMKTTKSVNVRDKAALIDPVLLGIKDGIDKGVKTFHLPYIRKLMEAEVVPEEVARFEENRKVYITKTED